MIGLLHRKIAKTEEEKVGGKPKTGRMWTCPQNQTGRVHGETGRPGDGPL